MQSRVSCIPELWLLTGDRLGEIAQQRIVGKAVGLPVRELQVARQKPAGGRAQFIKHQLEPPWPSVVISFGQTLPAAIALHKASGGMTRVVHLGRPGGQVNPATLDLVIPMPQDGCEWGNNVFQIRMPFNHPAAAGAVDTDLFKVLAELPRPRTVLILGGPARQLRFSRRGLTRIAADVNARVRARGGSLIISTGPRTPVDLVPGLRSAIDVEGAFYQFRRQDPRNPLRTYLEIADEIVVTGDSASMVAECWRTGKPLLVATLEYSFMHNLRNTLHRYLPVKTSHKKSIRANFEVNSWLQRLADDGYIGLFGRSEPWLSYAAADDDDLIRVAERIRAIAGVT